jgi:hypothetical protein
VPRRKLSGRSPRWARFSDEQLLELRFNDLRLSLKRALVAPHLQRLYRELDQRGLKFRPHVWLADEWFSPDGVPGFAIPFYLAHPRLARLERKMMQEVEGGNANWLMRILRHETGHAIDSAFRLRRRKDWRATFGKASRPYPKTYRPQPASKSFVLHLGHWYAQTHPTEDFAETFAVWLQPRSRWRRTYNEWPALAKLEYVDALMRELQDVKPRIAARNVIDPLSQNRRTLRSHYRRELTRYAIESTNAYDARLRRVFMPRDRAPNKMRAATFLRGQRRRCVRVLTKDVRVQPYLVHNTLREIIDRCRVLDLVVRGSHSASRSAVLHLVERIVFDTMYRHRQQYSL